MSVKKLNLTTSSADMHVMTEDNKIRIQVVSLDGLAVMMLNRNQAHLLMLWLQEHLK